MSEAVPQPTVLPALEGATELLLIRHGRSADVVPGSPESEDPPLHELGMAQAAALAERLATKPLAAIYASHTIRARETARVVAARQGLDVEIRPELTEVFLGEWERGEFRRRAAARDPQWVRFAESGRWDDIPGSEGDGPFRRRVSDAMGRITDEHLESSVAVVCHGGVINAYLADGYGMTTSFFCAIENTSVTLVRCGPHGRVVLAVNDCNHLYDPVLGGPPLS